MKVLIAMATESLADLLAASLSQYDIHICRNGPDALTQTEALHPDILLLELALPGMDGITVLKKSTFKPPIILALTNLVTSAVLQAAADAGVQDMILLPCTVRHIIEHLNVLIEKAPSAEA